MPTAFPSSSKPPVRLRLVRRPSLLDPFHNGDPWIKRCETEHSLVLYLQGQPIAVLAALHFDLQSLYQRLYDLRRRACGGRRF